jgi:hypothetical protein
MAKKETSWKKKTQEFLFDPKDLYSKTRQATFAAIHIACLNLKSPWFCRSIKKTEDSLGIYTEWEERA